MRTTTVVPSLALALVLSAVTPWAGENHVPTTVSPWAQDYLRDNEVAGIDGELTVEIVRAIRAQRAGDIDTVVEQIRGRLVSEIEERTIAGVPVVVLTPAGYDEANDDRAALYIHGGAYVVGTAIGPICADISHRMGVKVYSVDYRLAPEHPFPAGVDDCLAVYRALLKTIKPDRIVVFGASAGGGLTLATVLKARDAGLPLPAAVALLSPWSDITKTGDTYHTLEGIDPILHYEKFLRQSATVYGVGHDLKHPLISPVYADYSKGFPPALISTGTRDLFLSNCARLHRELKRAGVEAELNVWEGMWHVFEGFGYPEMPESIESLTEIAAFLDARLP
jgi:acetyl esterase/lipase